ncbi:MAG: xanthine dehydrogenase family protein molybdopterin-binding subunit [Gaiellaceae bacterium]
MKAIGARLPRYEGVGHVTGLSMFVDDVRLPQGNLWAKALRSPHHSAKIKSLDTTKAAAMPGVHAVITHEDVPKNLIGHLEFLGVPADEPLLAVDEVRYRGQPIAAVAADDEEAAQEAVEAIEIEYDEREPLFDMRNAFDPGAPQVHRWGNWFPYFGGELENAGPDRRQIRKGDLEWAFDQADRIVKGVYRPGAIEHCPLETQVSLAVPEPSGRMVVYSCTQAMHFSAGHVAAHLGVPLNGVKFVTGAVGGGFGGKVDTASESIASVLALKTEHPVKWRWTREEEFLCSGTRAAWHIEVADAVTKDGWILGRKTLSLHDAGAYLRHSSYATTKHTFHCAGAYTIPNVSFTAYAVFTNRVPTTAMRGFGVTSTSFLAEMQMNRIAKVLELDPYELRLKNANRIGDTMPNTVVLKDPSTVPVVQAIAEHGGIELKPEFKAMTWEPREGDLLPEWLVAQQSNGGKTDA